MVFDVKSSLTMKGLDLALSWPGSVLTEPKSHLFFGFFYMSDLFCSFHLEISHCDAPRAHPSLSRTTVTNL